jgi:hypothetical protein
MSVQVNPFVVKRSEFLCLIGSPLIGRRVLYAADHGVAPWCNLLRTIRQGGRGSERLLDYESARACYGRILIGEMPPLLPCEAAGLGQNSGSRSFLKTEKSQSHSSRSRPTRRRRADSPRATHKSRKGRGCGRGSGEECPQQNAP